MKTLQLFVLVFFSTLLSTLIPPCAASALASPPYTSGSSTEAETTFDTEVEFSFKPSTPNELPSPDYVMSKIDLQVSYLYGSMASATFRAGPRDDYDITNLRIARTGTRGTYKARYRFHGVFALQNGFGGSTYQVLLPRNPDTVYGKAKTTTGVASCVFDPHHLQPGEFYYYWNPRPQACGLQPGRDYLRISAEIDRLENTTRTYPEYRRLVASDGTLRIDVLMGMDNESFNFNPDYSGDVNAPQYRYIRNQLLAWGFREHRLTSREALALVHGRPGDDVPYIEEFTKATARAKLKIRLFFGPSMIDGGNARSFHYLLKDALENASILVYAGHSGFGANADLDQIEKMEGFQITPSLTRYQIYVFLSCSSYTAYTTGFFERKQTPEDPYGTKNLDILGTGLFTYMERNGQVASQFIREITDWAEKRWTRSYQTITRELDTNDLFSVSGDEDNPTSFTELDL